MITYDSKRNTEREFAHTDVYVDGEYIGYIIDNKLPYPTTYNPSERWSFVHSPDLYRSEFTDSTKKKVIAKIEEQYGTR